MGVILSLNIIISETADLVGLRALAGLVGKIRYPGCPVPGTGQIEVALGLDEAAQVKCITCVGH